jgi:hypothetical protein
MLARDVGPATRTNRPGAGGTNTASGGRSSAGAGDAGRPRGAGSGIYKVKGKRATAKQRETIDGCLAQAQEDNASRRVMIATVMCITQESNAGELASTMTGNDDVGIFQQGRNWVSEKGAKDPAASTHAFLITGPTSWKKVHGGVKSAPGNLDAAITRVQISVGGYAPWEKEATDTVDTWLDTGGSGGGSYIKQYNFTRGEKGGSAENSWDASARLVEEVGAYRWAAGNVLYAVSGDELRAGAPSLTIRGDESWLLRAPAYSWANNRAVTEVTMDVLGSRWDVMPGAIAMLAARFGPLTGRWMVWNVSGDSLESPVLHVVLRRPTRLRKEPASERAQRAEGEAGGSVGALYDICKRISDNRHEYSWGGSHGPKLSSLRPSSPFDCSSSCSYALYKAGMFDGTVAITSHDVGGFGEWGKAGKGDDFTVWQNNEHVWIEGYKDGEFAWRFDTSQHAGKSGPAVSETRRNDQGRFHARHWSG